MITFHQILAAGITQYCNSDLLPPTVKRCSVTAEPQFPFVTAADHLLIAAPTQTCFTTAAACQPQRRKREKDVAFGRENKVPNT